MTSYFITDAKAKSIIENMNRHGSNMNPKFINYAIPKESMLLAFKLSNVIRIGFGEFDEESPPAFSYYLQSMGIKNNG